ncbi:MAG: protein translocase subunit SecF [Proteobacteria bacterium]|nr:protein translocase subunit SecF [Pseudomonadota bacterium]MCP4920146.1 protein translocase subunit SecF [Pseudomonadota bacterium]
MNFLKPKNSIDFLGKRTIFGAVSAFLVICSIVSVFVVGPNWGIDFTGGTEIVLDFDEPTEIGEVRDAVGGIGLSPDAVQQINDDADYTFSIRVREATFGTEELKASVDGVVGETYGSDFIVQSRMDAQVGASIVIEHKPGVTVDLVALNEALAAVEGAEAATFPEDNTFQVKLTNLSTQVKDSIAGALAGKKFEVLKVDAVGPKVGGDLRTQGLLAMGATIAFILLYIAFRFDLVFAPGAVIALVHDVALTIGVFVLMGEEVNLSMIGALLTIIGYSLNDTIVIYDRVRENMARYRKSDTIKLINDSINETLGRTLATSITTGLAILPLLFLGGPVIRTFALALLIGVIVGTYSTIFVATPSILVMEKVKPVLMAWLAPSVAPDPAEAEGAVEGG